MSETTKVRVSREWWWGGWNHGKYVDFWTASHFLFGIIGAIGGTLLGISWTLLLVLLLGIFVFWEIFEWITEVGESFSNQVTDVLSSMVGLVLAWYILTLAPSILVNNLFTAFVLLFGCLEFWGHIAWRRRTEGSVEIFE